MNLTIAVNPGRSRDCLNRKSRALQGRYPPDPPGSRPQIKINVRGGRRGLWRHSASHLTLLLRFFRWNPNRGAYPEVETRPDLHAADGACTKIECAIPSTLLAIGDRGVGSHRVLPYSKGIVADRPYFGPAVGHSIEAFEGRHRVQQFYAPFSSHDGDTKWIMGYRWSMLRGPISPSHCAQTPYSGNNWSSCGKPTRGCSRRFVWILSCCASSLSVGSRGAFLIFDFSFSDFSFWSVAFAFGKLLREVPFRSFLDI